MRSLYLLSKIVEYSINLNARELYNYKRRVYIRRRDSKSLKLLLE